MDHLIIVGSWCLYFYKHHFGESWDASPLRTLDIDINVNLLRKKKMPVDIPELLKPLGFDIQFYEDGSINLIHPAIKIEFLVPEKGRDTDGPLKLPDFNITAQPLRFLNLLEEEILTVDYKGLPVKVPHPAFCEIFSPYIIVVSSKVFFIFDHPVEMSQQKSLIGPIVLFNGKTYFEICLSFLPPKRRKALSQTTRPGEQIHYRYR